MLLSPNQTKTQTVKQYFFPTLLIVRTSTGVPSTNIFHYFRSCMMNNRFLRCMSSLYHQLGADAGPVPGYPQLSNLVSHFILPGDMIQNHAGGLTSEPYLLLTTIREDNDLRRRLLSYQTLSCDLSSGSLENS